jgi:hypothetical protein
MQLPYNPPADASSFSRMGYEWHWAGSRTFSQLGPDMEKETVSAPYLKQVQNSKIKGGQKI